MSGTLSLNATIRTCKVDSGNASKIQSDRFQNPGNLTCPMFNGYDQAGRPAISNTINTKYAGCNNPSERILPENNLRPQYAEMITLNTGGVSGQAADATCLNGGRSSCSLPRQDKAYAAMNLKGAYNIIGSAGQQISSAILPGSAHPYIRAMDQNPNFIGRN